MMQTRAAIDDALAGEPVDAVLDIVDHAACRTGR